MSLEIEKPTVLILGNYKEIGNVGDDIYRYILTDVMTRKGINVVTSAASPRRVNGVILGGGGVLNAVSGKRLDVLERYGKSMPSAIISAGMEGCAIPENIGELLTSVDIATVRDILAWKYGRGSALLAPDMAFAIDPTESTDKGQRTRVGFSLRIKRATDLPRLNELCSEIALEEKAECVDVNSYFREKFHTRIPLISNTKDLSYNGSINFYLNELRKCDLVICSQYHAIILSIICGCAVCGYIYSRKVTGLVESLCLSKYFTTEVDKLPEVYKRAREDMPRIEKRLLDAIRRNATQTHVAAIEQIADMVQDKFKEESGYLW